MYSTTHSIESNKPPNLNFFCHRIIKFLPKRTKLSQIYLLVLDFDGVREQHRRDVTDVGWRHRHDSRLGQLLENPGALRRPLLPERGRGRHRRLRLHLDIAVVGVRRELIRRHHIRGENLGTKSRKNSIFFLSSYFCS